MFGLYAQHVNDFDYGPYVPAMQAASTPDGAPRSSVSGSGAVQVSADDRGAAMLLNSFAPVVTVATPSLQLTPVADGLTDPTDIAFSPDGRVFLSERAGRVRVIRDGQVTNNAASTLEDVSTRGGNGLLAIAIDPQFERTHFVYAIYTVASRFSEAAFRLARFREVQGALVGRTVLINDLPAAPAHAAASLRFGPDGKLYASFDTGGDPNRLGNLGSYNGKIVRINADGTTPDDQPMPTPVYAYGYDSPLGLDWDPATHALWIAGRDAGGLVRMRNVTPGEVKSRLAAEPLSVVLPPAAGGPGISFVRGGGTLPAARDLLTMASDLRGIVRIRVEGDPLQIGFVQRIVNEQGGVISALGVSPDGHVYYCVNGKLIRFNPGP